MAGKKSITGEILKLRNVRLSFPCLDVAKAPKNVKDAKESFGANFLLDPKTQVDQIKMCTAEIKRLRALAWGLDGKPHAKEKPLECFGKGETRTNNDDEIYKGYEGMYYLAGKNDDRPLLMGKDKKIITEVKDINRIFYGGCFVNANINFWVQDNDFGKAIRCGLRGVMFWADGEAFGGNRASESEFDDVEEGEGLEGLDDEFDDMGLGD